MNAAHVAEESSARIAAAIGDPARARMLYALMDGRALTSTDLALVAAVGPSTASAHLNRLKRERLVRVLVQGRHRYYSLYGTGVAGVLESLSALAGRVGSGVQTRTPEHLARARMLYALMDGRALTSTELALVAAVGPSTASAHLNRLKRERLVRVLVQGRHRYYSLYGTGVAGVLESLSALAGRVGSGVQTRTPDHLRLARTCYDHIAGTLGVLLHDRLLAADWIAGGDKSYEVTPKGNRALSALGIDVEGIKQERRRFAFPCLDWSERRCHLGGALGAAVLGVLLRKRWITRERRERTLVVTPLGTRELKTRLGVVLTPGVSPGFKAS